MRRPLFTQMICWRTGAPGKMNRILAKAKGQRTMKLKDKIKDETKDETKRF